MDWAAMRIEGLADFKMSVMPPTIQLPALPHAVTLFMERSCDETASLKDLATILETDTGLTFEMLKYVNSSFLGLRQQAKTVFQALSLLGRRQSRMLVMATGAQAAMQARKSKLINQQAFWNASLQKALFARAVAVLLKADADVAFSGSLLQDYLLPVLTNDLMDPYLEFIQSRENMPETLCEFEHNRFAWDHALAGACLAHRWNLPDELVCCILYHHSGLRILAHPQLGRTPVAAVALSALLPDQLRQHYHGLDLLSKLENKWPAFKLESLAETVDQQQAAMNLGVRNDFPLSRRCKCVAGARKRIRTGRLRAFRPPDGPSLILAVLVPTGRNVWKVGRGLDRLQRRIQRALWSILHVMYLPTVSAADQLRRDCDALAATEKTMSNVSGPDTHTRIFLVPHPKVVFLYPTFLVALIAGFYTYFTKEPAGRGEHIICLIFLAVLGFNLVVIAFDFPRTTSLTILFALLAIGIGLWFFFTEYPEWWPWIHHILASLKPAANAHFYFLFAAILAVLYVGVLINTRFDFWEVRQNELLHHHGIWSNQERFAAPNLRIDKEINDLVEYLLLGSGRLVLHPSEERRAIVLDNVFFVNRKEAQLTRLLGALQVEVKTDNS